MVNVKLLWKKLKFADEKTSFTMGEIEHLRSSFYQSERDYIGEITIGE